MKTVRTPVGSVLREAVFVAVIGATFAFAANRISPRGLALATDYFPAGTNPPVRAAAITTPVDSPTDTNPAAPPALLRLTTPTEGLEWRLIDEGRTIELLHDSHLRPGAIVFIDARDEEHYLEGHIPGAYGFDPYHPDKDFPAVMTNCLAAEQIVIYCYGSNCDDSQMAARLLRNVGISGQKIFVYGGGITEWTNNHQPVEIGARNSGNVNITIQ